jgi:hypothetical protein
LFIEKAVAKIALWRVKMQVIEWIIAAGTAIFVALVGYFQWRTAEQKAVLDLFERRYAIYEIVRKAVETMIASSHSFDQSRQTEFMDAMDRARFFFGDDVDKHLKELWQDIIEVRTADDITEVHTAKATNDPETRRVIVEQRLAALYRIKQFYANGQPLFARYMRFSQTIPSHRIDTALRKIISKVRGTR